MEKKKEKERLQQAERKAGDQTKIFITYRAKGQYS